MTDHAHLKTKYLLSSKTKIKTFKMVSPHKNNGELPIRIVDDFRYTVGK